VNISPELRVHNIPFPASSTRRHARERALELLYEAEMKSLSVADVLDSQTIPPDAYTSEIIRGIEKNLTFIDEKISSVSKDWAFERLAVVDRQLLRIAAYEIYFVGDVPMAVAIDEAIELAKQFSTEDSPKYINGILGALGNGNTTT
jgi:N utilization substance protein B